jgi:short-subunit dehydrogenase
MGQLEMMLPDAHATLNHRDWSPTAGPKHAALTFSESLYYELEPYGVKVIAVNPGFVSTEDSPNSQVPEPFLMEPDRIARGIGTVIERGIAPEFSIPRWLAPFQAVRVLTPRLYRAGVMVSAQEFRRQGAHPKVTDDPRVGE